MKRFSKLKKRIESLFSPELDLKIYYTVYQNYCYYGCNGLDFPRVWMVLNKEIIFDYCERITLISKMLHEYIETPVGKLSEYSSADDCYGLADILKAADRRFGKRRLDLLRNKTESKAAKRIIDVRLMAK